jgi:hypothetical protein
MAMVPAARPDPLRDGAALRRWYRRPLAPADRAGSEPQRAAAGVARPSRLGERRCTRSRGESAADLPCARVPKE